MQLFMPSIHSIVNSHQEDHYCSRQKNVGDVVGFFRNFRLVKDGDSCAENHRSIKIIKGYWHYSRPNGAQRMTSLMSLPKVLFKGIMRVRFGRVPVHVCPRSILEGLEREVHKHDFKLDHRNIDVEKI